VVSAIQREPPRRAETRTLIFETEKVPIVLKKKVAYFSFNQGALLLVLMHCARKYGGSRDRTQVAERTTRAADQASYALVPKGA
jgi:hypothetical protein